MTFSLKGLKTITNNQYEPACGILSLLDISLHFYTLRLTAYVKERNSETHSEGNQITPVKALAFSRDYVKDKLVQQILGWLSQKSLDIKVCLMSELLPWCFTFVVFLEQCYIPCENLVICFVLIITYYLFFM